VRTGENTILFTEPAKPPLRLTVAPAARRRKEIPEAGAQAMGAEGKSKVASATLENSAGSQAPAAGEEGS